MEIKNQSYDAVVVGAGIAGLTAATYLARAGQDVLLIEKNRECGGLVSSFSSDGFVFDAGVRALEDAGVIFAMLKDLQIELDITESPVSLGVENYIMHVEGIESLDAYERLLNTLYPRSAEEINAVLRDIKKIMKHMDVLYGIENPVFKDLKKDRKYIFKKLLPWLPRFIFTVRKINKLSVPVEGYLDNVMSNASLKDIISQHFFKNTPTFFALSYFSLYLDYFYPKGGMAKLAESVEIKYQEYGGQINKERTIIEISAHGHFVTDSNGNRYGYDSLIWAADLKTLYRKIHITGLTPAVRSEFEKTKTQMLRRRGGDSVYTLFVEVDEPLETFRSIAHGHFFYTPSRSGLGDVHRKELADLLRNWEQVDKEHVLSWLDRFTQLNTYEISVPGLRDPALAPPGKTGLIVSFLSEYDLFAAVKASGWYDEFVQAMEDRVLDVMSGSIYPMLRDKVIKHFSFTPLSIENRVGSSEGAITGWSFQETIPVVHKIQFADRSVLTPIPSVFQAGQWAYSPAGVPMSILTGKLAADRVLKNRGKSRGGI